VAVDITTIAESAIFEINTGQLGRICCGTLTLKLHANLTRALKSSPVSARDTSSVLLSLVGKRLDATETYGALSKDQTDQLKDEELENFAANFLEKNRWLIESGHREPLSEKLHGCSSMENLRQALADYEARLERNQPWSALTKFQGDLMRSDALISNHLRDAVFGIDRNFQDLMQSASLAFSSPQATLHDDLLRRNALISNDLRDAFLHMNHNFHGITQASSLAFTSPLAQLQGDLMRPDALLSNHVRDAFLDMNRNFKGIVQATSVTFTSPMVELHGDLMRANAQISNDLRDAFRQMSHNFHGIAQAASFAFTSPLAKIQDDLLRRAALVSNDLRDALGVLDIVANRSRQMSETALLTLNGAPVNNLNEVFTHPAWMPNHLSDSLATLHTLSKNFAEYDSGFTSWATGKAIEPFSISREFFAELREALDRLNTRLDTEANQKSVVGTDLAERRQTFYSRAMLVFAVASLVLDIIKLGNPTKCESPEAASRAEMSAIHGLANQIDLQRNELEELIKHIDVDLRPGSQSSNPNGLKHPRKKRRRKRSR
jgi:hypothetical protein